MGFAHEKGKYTERGDGGGMGCDREEEETYTTSTM
jgi:hypothetical protein